MGAFLRIHLNYLLLIYLLSIITKIINKNTYFSHKILVTKNPQPPFFMKQSSFLLFFLLFFQIILQGQTLDATLLELKFSNDGYPERFTEVENGFYFTVDDTRLWFTDGTKEGTNLVKNISSDISLIKAVGNKVFFIAEDGFSDYELWVSDGTDLGTTQLTNKTVPFSEDGRINELVEYQGKVYFGTYDDEFGNELWVSDGTPQGSYILKDIHVGETGSFPRDFFVFNEKLYFKATTEEFGTEIWVSDGTSIGTKLFKDIKEGPESSASYKVGHLAMGNHFYFFADNGPDGSELWKSDGTPNGTSLLKNIRPGAQSSNNSMVGGVLGDRFIFVANDGTHGDEFWISDGTEAGTDLLKDINPGAGQGIAYDASIVFANSKVFFYGNQWGPEPGLWVSDGTTQGTNFVKDVSFQTMNLDASGESVVFFGRDANFNNVLWKSDGTADGTQVISDKVNGTNTSAHENSIIVLNETIFFAGDTKRNGVEMWVTDLTEEGTTLFFDFDSSYGVIPSLLTEVGNQLFFRGNKFGTYDLCVSDGTIEGTRYLPINPDGTGIDDESEFIDFNGKLVVSANDGIHGYELWISDGTQEGTKMIKDINTGAGSSMRNSQYLRTFSVIDSRLYFVANDGIHGYEVWTSDGTESGTYMVKDLFPGTYSQGGYSSDPKHWTEHNGSIYFSATYSWGGGSHEDGIYKTDGTTTGTVKLFDLKRVEMIESVGEKLLVAAREFNSGINDPYYLWSIDTNLDSIEKLNVVVDYNDIPNHAILNEKLIFYGANKITNEVGILKSDGTSNGLTLLLDKTSHTYQNFGLGNILSCGEFAYFGVQQGLSGDRELWRTDGTIEGTIVLDQPSEEEFTSITEMTCFKDNLLYKNYRSDYDLLITNGQPNKVFGLALNISNGPPLSVPPIYLTSVRNKLYFSGSTTESGSEIYVANPLRIRPEGQLEDNDGDGVIDLFDECLRTPSGESVNEEGCAESQLDDDKDGVMNDIDQCLETPTGEEVNSNGCSESDLTDDDNDGINNNLDLCTNTPAGESVNENGCSQSQLDDDEDGVMNNLDICPETLPIYEVDNNGCPVVFELPSDNFTIEVTGISCVGKNNGQISIRAEQSFNYTATINGDEYTFSTELLVQNLYLGSYTLCITIEGELDFQRCFNLLVEAASEISGKSTTSIFNSKVIETIEMVSGTTPYTVSLNGIDILTTSSSVFNVDVSYGDALKVSSKFECEGVIEKNITAGNELLVYPNPTLDQVNILIAEKTVDDVVLKLFDSQQRLLSSKKHDISNGKIQISITDRPSGVYFLKVELNTPLMIKIIKQ